jgi:hypothetical protein
MVPKRGVGIGVVLAHLAAALTMQQRCGQQMLAQRSSRAPNLCSWSGVAVPFATSSTPLRFHFSHSLMQQVHLNAMSKTEKKKKKTLAHWSCILVSALTTWPDTEGALDTVLLLAVALLPSVWRAGHSGALG